MSTRLATGGRRIDRSRAISFTFDGRRMSGYEGDSIASALLANDVTLVGRSFKYHRPRGIVGYGPEEPNALVGIGKGERHEPNARATTVRLADGMEVISQNRWPSLSFDVGAVNQALSPFFPAGFYYKTFLQPRAFWKHVFEPVIRRAAGLGKPPKGTDPDRYEHLYWFTDVLVAGGGIAGLAAARKAAEEGRKVLLIEQQDGWGGRAVVDGAEIDGVPAEVWVQDQVATLASMPNVTMRTGLLAAGFYDHGYVLCRERLSGAPGPRERLWRVRAKEVVVAAGAIERPLAFAGNDTPGVMLASAVRDFAVNDGVSPGDRTVIVTNNDDAYRTALVVLDAGLTVAAVIDARKEPKGALVDAVRERGVRVMAHTAVCGTKGGKRLTAVELCSQAGEGGAVTETVECDCLAMSGGWTPAVHLWSQAGGKLVWDEDQALFRPDPDRPPTGANGQAVARVVGTANGVLDTAGVLADAGSGSTAPEEPGGFEPIWQLPQGANYEIRSHSFLDFQNDVKVSDVELAAREGFESVEHAKRYTTLGMATDQGKLSNMGGIAVLSKELAKPIPEVGTTTFRPPYAPITMGTLAGEAKGALFQPVRETPLHPWHDAFGADWEPVGNWRRPYCYLRKGEKPGDAVKREVLNTRQNLGLLDASTLGKIVVKGPDAGRFLDMLYTNMMSTLPEGKCRYGLMCSENGFLIDDGVVVRMGPDEWLCHTTTGGADRIHAHMEEWLQTEWFDWKVYVANVTEQWGQIAVVGPKAREALEALGGIDVSKDALPFMQWVEGELAGIPARVFRISFSGELSYEVAVPASRTRELWDRLLEIGRPLGVMPYGTECLHVLRAEKGFIMIGDETDGTVIPQDLGLGWAISKKKDDYLGKRAQERSFMASKDRWTLVGLETVDGTVLPDGTYALGQGENKNGQRKMIGRVTSTYYSPTLDRGIAMGLVQNGPGRMGEVIEFGNLYGDPIKAKIVSPVFYDPEGEKQNV